MKIMVYNTQHCLNYITRQIDFELIAGIIKDYGADIVGLNEIRNVGMQEDYQDQAKILADLAGYDYHYFAQAIKFSGVNPYGNVLLSKNPIVQAQTILVPDPPRQYDGYYETRCLLKAKLDNGLTVNVIHFGLNPDEQENAVKTIMDNLENEKCILMGDFNVSPDNPVLAPIRARMKDTADLFKQPLLSFPSDKPKVKIDYIFVSHDIEVIDADIPAIIGADHRPHMAEVRMPFTVNQV